MNTTLEASQAASIQPYRMLRGAIVFLGVAVLGSAAALVWVQTRQLSAPPALSATAAPAIATPVPEPAPAVALAPAAAPAIVINNHAGPARAAPVASPRQAANSVRNPEPKPVARANEPAVAARPAPVEVAPAPATPAPQVAVQGTTTVPPAVVATVPAQVDAPAAAATAPLSCANCGTVESVSAINRNAATSGTGVVAGGVLGAVVGNQIGKGSGRTLGTIIGAIGGGMAGNAVEKQMKKETVYQVRVRLDDGSSRVIEQRTAPAVGSRINLDNSAAVEAARRPVPTPPSGGYPVYDASRI